ncbi:MAG: bifunctional precorrin-2 dehydrogenase/sirohydrochlorin ferrochelatase [Candidatus Omnitrophica bacterium]|nr:bifunctional precorrin-2 dehydrogenase/sirohydrochlorin ferrochelatase [Candidatus Omnitrophota bacterium]
MAYYPLFLELRSRPCLVIGGGKVAHQKVKALAACGAAVTVVAPRLGAGLQRLVREGKVRWMPKGFGAADLKGAELAVAAADDQRVNELASRLAKRRRIWINVVDQPRLCSFIVPSVVRRGDLQIAISTGGISPALSKWIRRDLEKRFGREFAGLLKGSAKIRGKVREAVPSYERRKRLYERAIAAYFDVMREGGSG